MNQTDLPEDAYTVPYWMEKEHDDGSIWFNEHQGNKIARFDPVTNTLYEYWIPTQNRLWGDCPPSSKTCGIANVLQFSNGENGQTWFTELSENKIGSIATPAYLLFISRASGAMTLLGCKRPHPVHLQHHSQNSTIQSKER